MNSTELDILIIKTAGGDMEALESIYLDTREKVYAYALSVTKNTHDAEDVLHDCYLKIYRGASGYVSQGKPMAWILTIAKNLCLAKLNEHKDRVDLTEEEWNDRLEAMPGLTTEERTVLKNCLSLLAEEERQIVVLHAIAGYKHREIAEHMNLPLSTVLSKYNRALAKLEKM
ncbi:MAG: RNA polymerase sigma factor [Firmicutes bacterium]|nr:RNA polymerase sigma factor [Bacillota bacterium]